jgi:hypothetical protein
MLRDWRTADSAEEKRKEIESAVRDFFINLRLSRNSMLTAPNTSIGNTVFYKYCDKLIVESYYQSCEIFYICGIFEVDSLANFFGGVYSEYRDTCKWEEKHFQNDNAIKELFDLARKNARWKGLTSINSAIIITFIRNGKARIKVILEHDKKSFTGFNELVKEWWPD